MKLANSASQTKKATVGRVNHQKKFWFRESETSFTPKQNKKKYETDCVNTKNAFRLIQSIPNKKAEPFKMWLAQIGKERLEEIENPELSVEAVEARFLKRII